MGADFQSPPIQASQPKVNNSVLVVNPTLFEVEVKHFVPVCGIYLIAAIRLLRDPPCTAHSCVLDVSPRVPQHSQPCREESLSKLQRTRHSKIRGRWERAKMAIFMEASNGEEMNS